MKCVAPTSSPTGCGQHLQRIPVVHRAWRRWVSYQPGVDRSHWVQAMNSRLGVPNNVTNLQPADGKGVSDEVAMAPPWDRLGAHDGHRRLLGQADQAGERLPEGRRRHIVRPPAHGTLEPATLCAGGRRALLRAYRHVGPTPHARVRRHRVITARLMRDLPGRRKRLLGEDACVSGAPF